MSKILITSIGAGGNFSIREGTGTYKTAKYCSDDRSNYIETPFIFIALKQLYAIDKCIFLGTAGSSWHMLYEYIFQAPDKLSPCLPYDEEYSFSLLELNEVLSNADTKDAVKDKLAKLRETLGDICADIIILNNGTNRAEIDENLGILIASLNNVVKDGDSICFDITYSFRSLALYELIAVNYFKDAIGKDIRIESVFYGMFELSSQNGGLTPIIDLSSVTSLIEWIKAAEEYKKFGTACHLSELIKKEELGISISREERKALGRLGNISSFDSINEFRHLVKNCVRISKFSNSSELNSGKIKIFDYIFNDISNRFGNKIEDDVLFYSEIAKWHFEYERYHLCGIVLVEGILNYMASLIKIDRTSKSWLWQKDLDFRRKVSVAKSSNPTVGNFLKYYEVANELRNKLCHLRPLSKNELEALNEKSKGLHSMIKKQFKSKPENERDLIKALEEA